MSVAAKKIKIFFERVSKERKNKAYWGEVEHRAER